MLRMRVVVFNFFYEENYRHRHYWPLVSYRYVPVLRLMSHRPVVFILCVRWSLYSAGNSRIRPDRYFKI